MKLNKEEIKTFCTLYEKAIAFDKRIESKRTIPLVQEEAKGKTIGDMMAFVLLGLTKIAESITEDK